MNTFKSCLKALALCLGALTGGLMQQMGIDLSKMVVSYTPLAYSLGYAFGLLCAGVVYLITVRGVDRI